MTDVADRIQSIRAFRDSIFLSDQQALHQVSSLSDIKRLVIINSASRSGSSLLYALLGKLPQVYSLTGEAAPFYKLNSCLGAFDPHESDRIPSELLDSVIDYNGLSMDFLSDLWLAEIKCETDQIDAADYVDSLMLRLVLQWTDVEFDAAVLKRCITQVFDRYINLHRHFDVEAFYLDLLEQLHGTWPQVNPFYYDIGTDKVALRFPFLDVPASPPVSCFTIEEPPFILLAPRPRPTADDLSTKTLLLKSTVDCYRMNLIERLFPNADIKIIHLVRNPAATINGLFDGWLHRGFFSHNLEHRFGGDNPGQLGIPGYSDRFPHGTHWWNFDLPSGWQDYIERDLVDVCAFQWHSANQEILGHLASTHRPVCVVHFENLLRSPDSRMSDFERILDFMSLPSDCLRSLDLNNLPIVQSTLPPQLYRWKNRQDMINRALVAPHIREMAEMFGYSSVNMGAWL
jgi:hypothetical protein